MQTAAVLAFVVAAVVSRQVNAQVWNYDDTTVEGPSNWVDSYPSCGGVNQSPINIVTSNLTPLTGSSTFTFTNYGRISASPYTLTNSGHSAMVTVNVKDITVADGGLGSTYVLEQFHFHWGTDDVSGSEHQIDSLAQPVEIHFVHYNGALYPDVATAAASNDPTAIAVLAVFVEVDDAAPTPDLSLVVDHLPAVLYEGDSNFVDAFNLTHILPSSLTSFFRYSGSLTTPGCNEVVVWTIFTQPIYITSAQLDKFRQIHTNIIGDPDEFMTHNFRPAQPINSRTIYLA